MKTSSPILIAVLFSIGCSFASAAPQPDVIITVHSDDVVVNGQRFDHADRLERHVTSLTPRSVRVQACGASALTTWKFVVYCLRRLPLEPAVVGANDSACTRDGRLTPVSFTQGTPLLRAAHDPAVDRFWNEMMP